MLKEEAVDDVERRRTKVVKTANPKNVMYGNATS
jgi:hypothetical protein